MPWLSSLFMIQKCCKIGLYVYFNLASPRPSPSIYTDGQSTTTRCNVWTWPFLHGIYSYSELSISLTHMKYLFMIHDSDHALYVYADVIN